MKPTDQSLLICEKWTNIQGIKWLIRGPDHHKVNQLYSLEHPVGCFATLDFSFLMKYFSNDLNRYNDGGMQTFLVK